MNSKPQSSGIPATRNRRSSPEQREFDDRKKHQPMLADLYRKAEARLRSQKKSQPSKAAAPQTESDPARLLHELEVHQIELELQNAELRQARDELEAALENYTDLYDFAPAGYFTLAADRHHPPGQSHGCPVWWASSVHVWWASLLGNWFPPPSVLLSICSSNRSLPVRTNSSIDIELPVKGQPRQVVRVRAKRSPTGLDCRAVVVDITGLKREEDKVRVSEIRYRRLFEAAHDGVLLLDPGTRKITDANPFMTKLLGYRARPVGRQGTL